MEIDLAGQIATIERTVVQLKRSIAIVRAGAESPPRPPRDAIAICRARERRNRIFGEHAAVFSDPSWDILLVLHSSRSQGARLSVSAVASAGDTPATTGLRHLEALEARGLIVRRADPMDKRRFWIELSPLGARLMDQWIATL